MLLLEIVEQSIWFDKVVTFVFLIAMTVTYLVLVGLVKRPLMRQYTQ